MPADEFLHPVQLARLGRVKLRGDMEARQGADRRLRLVRQFQVELESRSPQGPRLLENDNVLTVDGSFDIATGGPRTLSCSNFG